MASEREKLDKPKGGNSIKHIPKDAQVIMSILKDLGIVDYEPRVINQLLEFTYRYVTCILDDAKIYANHGKKKTIDLEDVKLASQMTLEKAFTGPPPRDVLLDLARGRNITALPLIKPHCGLRLPPDRYCLVAANYKLRSVPVQPRKMSKSALGPNIKGNRAQAGPPLKRPVNNASKSQTVVVPRPVIKFSGEATIRNPPSGTKVIKVQSRPLKTPSTDVKMEVSAELNSAGGSNNANTSTVVNVAPSGGNNTSSRLSNASSGGVKRKFEDDTIEFDPQF